MGAEKKASASNCCWENINLKWRKLRWFLLLKQPRERRFRVRKIYKGRKEKDEFHCLVKQARLIDVDIFFEIFRMSPSEYEEMLSYVAPLIQKNSKRESITPRWTFKCYTSLDSAIVWVGQPLVELSRRLVV